MKTLISAVLGPAIVAVTLTVVTTTAQADVNAKVWLDRISSDRCL